MSNNIEIIMDIDTLEIFEVIDHSATDKPEVDEVIEETSEQVKDYDEMDRKLMPNGRYYYKPDSVLWQVGRGKVIHTLKPKTKHGVYPYQQREPGSWGHVSQLTDEEALWLTLEFNPEGMEFIC